MLLIDEFSAKVSKDAYGGSAELVDDAILCFSDELKAEFKTGLEVADVNIHIAGVDMENEKGK